MYDLYHFYSKFLCSQRGLLSIFCTSGMGKCWLEKVKFLVLPHKFLTKNQNVGESGRHCYKASMKINEKLLWKEIKVILPWHWQFAHFYDYLSFKVLKTIFNRNLIIELGQSIMVIKHQYEFQIHLKRNKNAKASTLTTFRLFDFSFKNLSIL